MAGFIYVLSNPAFDGLLKIGKSAVDPAEERVAALYSTGVPAPFKLEFYAFVENYDEVEREVHRILAESRPNPSREFFCISVTDVVEVIRYASEVIYERAIFEQPSSPPDFPSSGAREGFVLTLPTEADLSEAWRYDWTLFRSEASWVQNLQEMTPAERVEIIKFHGRHWEIFELVCRDEVLITYSPYPDPNDSNCNFDGMNNSKNFASSEITLVKKLIDAVRFIRSEGGGFFKIRCDDTSDVFQKRLFLYLVSSPYVLSVWRVPHEPFYGRPTDEPQGCFIRVEVESPNFDLFQSTLRNKV
jgi:hypothetical protein